ncbi:MAG TPA: glycosyltransferase family 4 protein [Thermoanaerobacterales bacterium]|nr:glycosyltransferase family 4 protein [Thermoanaerobacterales bacterium]
MNILMISPYFYPEGGGAEFYMYKIAESLSKNHEVTVLCTTSEKEHPLNDDNIEVKALNHQFKISTTPVALTAIRDMVLHIRHNNYDLCNINYYLPLFPDMATIAAKICGLPSVLTWHNDVHAEGLLKLLSASYNLTLNKLTLKMVNKIITPSPYCYNESKFLRNLKNNMEWVPPGVDIKKYEYTPLKAVREEYGIPANSDIILFVGVMNKATSHKGVKTLFNAFKKICKDTGSFLVMVGKGNMISNYIRICKDLEIDERVVFTGFIEESTLINFYRESKILILPSTTIQEGFGMVLIEANACGKPVIGSKIGGIKYVIKDGETGLLVPPGDPDALADAIMKILDDEDLAHRMGSNGRRMVMEKYTWNKSAKMTERIFENLLNK